MNVYLSGGNGEKLLKTQCASNNNIINTLYDESNNSTEFMQLKTRMQRNVNGIEF